jgi:AcrR family transcriptional regulator
MTEIDRALLEAGRRVLKDGGWHATTAERIAAEAGISRVTLHRRGIRREHILAGLSELAVASYREALWPIFMRDGSGAERLDAAVTALCGVAEDFLEVLVALQAVAGEVFHDDGPGETDTRSEFTEPLEKLLRDGLADGTLSAPDPHETAVVLFNAVGWTYVHLRSQHRWPPARAREGVLRLVLHGVVA